LFRLMGPTSVEQVMAGVAQINVVIPNDSPTGSVPLALLVNGVFSPPGVTIAIK